MHMIHDDDEWETVSSCTPCSCGGDLLSGTCKRPGACNASAHFGQRRRPPEEVAEIKRARRERHCSLTEDALREAAEQADAEERPWQEGVIGHGYVAGHLLLAALRAKGFKIEGPK